MDVERQKLRKNYDFTLFIVTLSREMDVEGQKLGKYCDFTLSIATLSHEMDVEQIEVKLRFHGSGLCV
jgi:hypothetical protein